MPLGGDPVEIEGPLYPDWDGNASGGAQNAAEEMEILFFLA